MSIERSRDNRPLGSCKTKVHLTVAISPETKKTLRMIGLKRRIGMGAALEYILARVAAKMRDAEHKT